MPDKKFPRELVAFASNPNMKRVFVLDFEPALAEDCTNCGGLGHLYLFAAVKGPFREPVGLGGKMPDGRTDMTCKWHDGRWWGGAVFGFICPVCNGQGYVNATYRPMLLSEMDRDEQRAVMERAEHAVERMRMRE